jgi:hypothetical protein
MEPKVLAKLVAICTIPEYERGDIYLARLDPACNAGELTPRPPAEPVVVAKPGFYDDFDPTIVFYGEWSHDESFEGPSRHTISYNDIPRAEVKFAFDGKALNWIFTKAPNRGIAEVSIDGGTCATVGVLGTAVAILGSVQAHLVLHLLLGLEPTVLGRVVTFDAKRLIFGGFGFEGSPEPEGVVPFIAPSALLPDDFVIDLRGADEAPRTFAEGRRVDVAGIDAIATELPASRRIVLCCRSGQRALMAADKLRDRGFDIALVALG